MIDGCTDPHLSKGLCSKHYYRAKRGQDVTAPTIYEIPWQERFWRKVDKRADGCWIWTGSRDEKGYGHFRTGQPDHPAVSKAHRVAYELLVGPIPVGLTLDHFVCFDTSCVNPEHTRPLDRPTNTSLARQRTIAMRSSA